MKDPKRESGEVKDLKEIMTVLNWTIDAEAKDTRTTAADQFTVFSLQEKKQEVMKWLKSEIQKLDEENVEFEKKEGTVLIRQKDDKFIRRYKMATGDIRTEEVSLGALMTDGDWGLEYQLDPVTVPRIVRKEFLIETAKRKLQDYLDQQILAQELGSRNTDDWKKHAYGALRAERESGSESGGHALEKMVRNFFKKLVFDHKLPIEVAQTDLYQDVEQKIDLIFRRPKRYRGVGIEEGGEGIAVQLTKNTDPGVLEKKRQQIRQARRRIDSTEDAISDILLVTVGSDFGAGSVPAWRKAGRPSGGPDAKWSMEFKEKVFKTVMKGFLQDEEIGEYWQQIENGQLIHSNPE